MNCKSLVRTLALLATAGWATFSVAQAQVPAKPASRNANAAQPATPPVGKTAPLPATQGGVKTMSGLNGGAPGGQAAGADARVLTREELRACFKQRDDLGKRVASLDEARARLDAERQELTREQTQMRTEREDQSEMRSAIQAHNAKSAEFKSAVEAWNKETAAYVEEVNRRRDNESTRRELNRRQEELKQRQKELEEERQALQAKGEALARTFNARADALNQRVAEWNQRNEKLAGDSEALRDEREAWTKGCGNRRYREDDEKALAAGQ